MYIYGLIDPRGPELFYVGCTAKPSARLRRHRNLRSTSAGKKLKARIRAIKHSGNQLEMVILEQTEDSPREYAWIAFFDHLGLANTVRRPVIPYIKKTSEELSAIARESWIKKKQKFDRAGNNFILRIK